MMLRCLLNVAAACPHSYAVPPLPPATSALMLPSRPHELTARCPHL